MIDIESTRSERIHCTVPGIRNHNGTPKPVATLVPGGIWVFCRWSREMEFISREQCLAFWEHNGNQEHNGEPC